MSICVVPFVVCLVLRSLRFTACRVFSGCISLGVKQVRTPRHNQWRPAQPQAPRTRRHDRPHARLALGDDRRMEREASRSGRRRRQTPEKTSDWHTRLASNQRPAVLETAALRLVRTKRYMRRSARRVNQPTARRGN